MAGGLKRLPVSVAKAVACVAPRPTLVSPTHTLLPPSAPQPDGSKVDSSGDDDYFSTDLPDSADGVHKHPLDQSFGKLDVPALALFSEKDEFAHVKDVPAHLGRWEKAAGGKLDTHVVAGASHAVDEARHWPDLCAATVKWLMLNF